MHAEDKPPDDLLARIRVNTAAIIRHLADKELVREGPRDSDLNPAELFADNVRKSLLCHSEILDHPFDPEDFRMARIKSDTATSVLPSRRVVHRTSLESSETPAAWLARA